MRIKVFRKGMFVRCWLTENKYPTFSYGYPHGKVHMASNFDNAELVRHLCSNSRCINPLHHKQGSNEENGKDRSNYLKFTRPLIFELFKTGIEISKAELMAERKYADIIAYRLKRLKDEGKIDWRSIELAKAVWRDIIIGRCDELIVMDNYLEGIIIYKEVRNERLCRG